jgi:hypothetical protein
MLRFHLSYGKRIATVFFFTDRYLELKTSKDMTVYADLLNSGSRFRALRGYRWNMEALRTRSLENGFDTTISSGFSNHEHIQCSALIERLCGGVRYG